MRASSRGRPGSSLLNDHSELDFTGLTPADIRDISDLVSRLDEQHGFGPVAVVVPNAFAFGLARMGQTLVTTDVLGRIFYSRDAAVEWLGQVEAGEELDD